MRVVFVAYLVCAVVQAVCEIPPASGGARAHGKESHRWTAEEVLAVAERMPVMTVQLHQLYGSKEWFDLQYKMLKLGLTAASAPTDVLRAAEQLVMDLGDDRSKIYARHLRRFTAQGGSELAREKIASLYMLDVERFRVVNRLAFNVPASSEPMKLGTWVYSMIRGGHANYLSPLVVNKSGVVRVEDPETVYSRMPELTISPNEGTLLDEFDLFSRQFGRRSRRLSPPPASPPARPRRKSNGLRH